MKPRVNSLLICIVLWSALALPGMAQDRWRFHPLPQPVSIRGLSCVDDNIVWCVGSQKSVFYSANSGDQWQSIGGALPLADDVEIRSVHAFDSSTAVIATAGQPAKIFRTTNAGKSWSEVFHLVGETAFIDGLRFSGSLGCAFSDPIDGRLPVLISRDAGLSWQVLSDSDQPKAVQKEAGFAASNSSIFVRGNSCLIGTGGTERDFSRLHRLEFDSNLSTVESVSVEDLVPLPSSASQGIFSLAVKTDTATSAAEVDWETMRLVAVGGDYQSSDENYPTAVVSTDGGRNWEIPARPPLVFQSCVLYVPTVNQHAGIFLSTGKALLFASEDGTTWQQLDSPTGLADKSSGHGFHVLAVGERHVYAAGAEGLVAKIEIEHLLKNVATP